MKKVMCVFGTRPEAIKMAPVVKAIEQNEYLQSVVAVTAQHREMLDQVLQLFDIVPNYDLNLMKHGQTLTTITSGVLAGLHLVFRDALVLQYGGTATMSTAPDVARTLAARLTGPRLTALMEQVEVLREAQLRNMNNTLLLTRLCACLRQAAGY